MMENAEKKKNDEIIKKNKTKKNDEIMTKKILRNAYMPKISKKLSKNIQKNVKKILKKWRKEILKIFEKRTIKNAESMSKK